MGGEVVKLWLKTVDADLSRAVSPWVARAQDEMTPLRLAAEKGHAECVRLLVEKGARVDSASNWVRVRSTETMLAVASAPIPRGMTPRTCGMEDWEFGTSSSVDASGSKARRGTDSSLPRALSRPFSCVAPFRFAPSVAAHAAARCSPLGQRRVREGASGCGR